MLCVEHSLSPLQTSQKVVQEAQAKFGRILEIAGSKVHGPNRRLEFRKKIYEILVQKY